MKKFEVKLRCCSSAVIQMSFAILGATKEKSTFGYEGSSLLWTSKPNHALD